MIIDLQRRIAEVGRIRIGQQVATGRGKTTRPTKLTTFRLTSADRTRIHQAAVLYGGTPTEWDAPAGKQWEVVTTSDALNVIVPPGDMSFSQHYELWSGGGCQRRCDGQFESISDQACICDPDRRECKIHTRLSVMLRDLPGLGVWRIDTSGYYAAVELQGAVEVVQMAAGAGQMLPAKLRLEQRMIKRANEQTKRFAVPVLDIEVSPAQLLSGQAVAMLGDGTPGTVAIEPPRPRQVTDGGAPLTPVPESVPTAPAAPIAQQAAQVKTKPKRSNAAQPVPRTGLAPRTAAQAGTHQQEPPPDEPPPDDDRDAPPPPSNTVDPDGPASAPQNRKMHAQFRDADITERADRLLVTSAILGFPLNTSSGLTVSEASKVIDTLEQWQQAGATDANVREILNTASLAADADEPIDAEIITNTTEPEQEN